MALPTPPPTFRLNFGEAFAFLFRDPHWPRKCALAALCSLFSFTFLPYLLVAGYLLTLSERVMRLEPQPLPAWTDLGTLLRKGWRVFIVRVVYYLPVWLISLCMVGLVLAAFFSLGGISLFRGTTTIPSTSLAPFWLFFLIIPLGLLLIPLGLASACIVPAADAQLVLHEGQLEPAFRLGAVFAFIRRNLGQYALMVILYAAASRVLSGGSSAGFQFSGGFGGGGIDRTLIVFLVLIALIFVLVSGIVGLYLRCFQAHMIGQLCWYEREVRGHEH